VETIVLVNLAMEIIRAHRLMGIIADLILEWNYLSLQFFNLHIGLLLLFLLGQNHLLEFTYFNVLDFYF
jgi:hypothetical protein